jgi:hypothetical protein
MPAPLPSIPPPPPLPPSIVAGVTFLNGSSTTLASYAGKVLMITNVAVRGRRRRANRLCPHAACPKHTAPAPAPATTCAELLRGDGLPRECAAPHARALARHLSQLHLPPPCRAQYTGLNYLLQTVNNPLFAVLGFPCNQFAGQVRAPEGGGGEGGGEVCTGAVLVVAVASYAVAVVTAAAPCACAAAAARCACAAAAVTCACAAAAVTCACAAAAAP